MTVSGALGSAWELGASTACGAGIGALEVGLFYWPGVPKGPTRRLHHLMACGTLLVLEGFLLADAFGLSADGPPSADRPMAVGVALGGALGGGWFASVRRRHAQAAVRPAGARGPGRPATGSSRLRTARRRAFRSVDYAFGMGLCGTALICEVVVEGAVRPWFQQRVPAPALVALGAHVSTFLFTQVVTNRALAVLNTAVREDWRMRRRSQFLLAAGPFLYALPISTVAPGAAASLVIHLLALWLGYRRTDLPPSGILPVARQLVRGRQPAAARRPGRRDAPPDTLRPAGGPCCPTRLSAVCTVPSPPRCGHERRGPR